MSPLLGNSPKEPGVQPRTMDKGVVPGWGPSMPARELGTGTWVLAPWTRLPLSPVFPVETRARTSGAPHSKWEPPTVL